MYADLFEYLPSQIIINILSRLPLRNIICCKFVSKSWRASLETPEFFKSHNFKPIQLLGNIRGYSSRWGEIFEFEYGFDVEQHCVHIKPVMKFPFLGRIHGSANGLLFLWRRNNQFAIRICNPITHEYIELDGMNPSAFQYIVVSYGFGVSKISGQYKVVRIFHELGINWKREFLCEVYTIGTRLWKRISSIANHVESIYPNNSIGTFLNGNLHWLVPDTMSSPLCISCLDLETELFTTFSSPISRFDSVCLGVLEDCLCLCHNMSGDNGGTAIWLMKEYGAEESWTIQYFISDSPLFIHNSPRRVVCPVKVFKDGGILMVWNHQYPLYYSDKDKTVKELDMFGPYGVANALFNYTPEFFSLKRFEMENVKSFDSADELD